MTPPGAEAAAERADDQRRGRPRFAVPARPRRSRPGPGCRSAPHPRAGSPAATPRRGPRGGPPSGSRAPARRSARGRRPGRGGAARRGRTGADAYPPTPTTTRGRRRREHAPRAANAPDGARERAPTLCDDAHAGARLRCKPAPRQQVDRVPARRGRRVASSPRRRADEADRVARVAAPRRARRRSRAPGTRGRRYRHRSRPRTCHRASAGTPVAGPPAPAGRRDSALVGLARDVGEDARRRPS